MTNLAQRTFTGIVLVIVTTISITLSPLTFILFILTLNILGLVEFYKLFKIYTGSPRNISGIILSVTALATFILVVFNKSDWHILLLNIPLTFSIFISEIYLKSIHPFLNLAIIFLGIICITIPLCFFITLALLPLNSGKYPGVAIGYFLILWLNDSGAYFIGKNFGTRPLFLRLSPKKTWEGSFGGGICALSITIILSKFLPVFTWEKWFFTALIIIVTGTFGDLIKSLMKRSLHIKDSGHILPGHGGILDRFDSLLGSAPFVFCYLSLS